MAQEDFCFTYYDGDAARDKAHMSRLERGAYDDLISAQRKFGHLDEKIIRKVLGADYQSCWPSIELIMKVDEEGKYYIEWLENSVQKSRQHSKIQSDRIKKYWEDVRSGKIPRNSKKHSTDIPRNKNHDTADIPLENGDGDETGSSFERARENFSSSHVVPQMQQVFLARNEGYADDDHTDYPQLREIAEKIMRWKKLRGRITDPLISEKILHWWEVLAGHIRGDKHLCRYSLMQINKHFQAIVQSFHNGTTHRKSSAGGHGKSAGAISIADELARELGVDTTGAGDPPR